MDVVVREQQDIGAVVVIMIPASRQRPVPEGFQP
jgi:hypothetical protein